MDLHHRLPGTATVSRVDAHVTIAGGLLWLLGGLGVLIATRAMMRALDVAGLEAVIFAYGALAALVVAAASLVAGFGLQRGLPWGWRASVVVYCAWSMLVLPLAAYGIYALMRRHVREAFEPPDDMPARAPALPQLAPHPRRRLAAQVMLMPAIAGLPGPAWRQPTVADDTTPTAPTASFPEPWSPAPRVRTDRRWPAWQLPRRRRLRANVMQLQAVDLAPPPARDSRVAVRRQ